MIAAVVFLIHVRTPHQHIPKLFIKNVPKNVDEHHLKVLLEENGYCYGEFGIPWANHYIELGISKAHPQVKGAWRRGDVEVVDYNDLNINWDEIDEEN